MRAAMGLIANRRVLLVASSLCLVAGACGTLEPESGAGITLVNTTADTIGYVALERDASDLALLPGSMLASDLGDRIVAPSASVLVPLREIDGYYAGASVRFHIYCVSGRGAVIQSALTFTHAELVAMRWRVEVSAPAVAPSEVTFVNAMPDTLGYLAVEADSSHTLSIRERLPASELGKRVIPPSDSVAVPVGEIEWYQDGSSLHVFLYRVSQGEAVYRGMLTVPHLQLVARQWRAEISESSYVWLNPAQCSAHEEALLTLVDSSAVTGPEALGRLQRERDLPWAADVRVARVSPTAASLLGVGQTIAIDVSPGRRFVALGERMTRRADDDISWHAELCGAVFGSVDLVLTPRGVTATLRANRAVYGIRPIGDGFHAITLVDQRKMPPDHPP